ncbi:MAG: glutamyl-tRNA reductase [Flavobacteriales bacterium]
MKSTTNNQFISIGISHWNCPIEIREKFSITDSNLERLHLKAKSLDIVSLFVVSTCNRTQLFSFGNVAQEQTLIDLFIEATETSAELFNEFAFLKREKEATDLLFELCMGLDSMILGDLQIISQVKNAVTYASKFDLIDSETHRLMQYVLQCYKAVSTDTDINSGPASIAHAAVLYIKNRFKQLSDKNILLYGLGEIGETTVKNLIENHKIGSMTLINRTFSKAEKLAKELNVQSKEVEFLTEEIDRSDIVIVATGALNFTVSESNYNNKSKNPKVFIDLAVPRNIDPVFDTIAEVDLIEMDELNKIQDETLTLRRKNIPKVRTIINLHKFEFYDWIKMRKISPLINAYRKKMHDQRLEELEKQKFKFSEEEYNKADLFSKSIVNKMVNQNIEFIKGKYRTSEDIADIFADMYQLKNLKK